MAKVQHSPEWFAATCPRCKAYADVNVRDEIVFTDDGVKPLVLAEFHDGEFAFEYDCACGNLTHTIVSAEWVA